MTQNNPSRSSVSTNDYKSAHPSRTDACADRDQGQPTFIDLCAGIGGFRFGFEQAGAKCVWSCEKDPIAAETYLANHGDDPTGDITEIAAGDIPDHDILCAGYPCQSFSIQGTRRGMCDPRGRVIWQVYRILAAKRPAAFVLENVDALRHRNHAGSLAKIIDALTGLGYRVHYRVLDARRFGLPQRRRRLFIVGFLQPVVFEFPSSGRSTCALANLLEREIPTKHYYTAQPRERMIARRERQRAARENHCYRFAHPTHANTLPSDPKGLEKNVIVAPDGRWRRLTPRECARLQGFPDDFVIHPVDTHAYRQLGNAVAVPVATAVAERVVAARRGDDPSVARSTPENDGGPGSGGRPSGSKSKGKGGKTAKSSKQPSRRGPAKPSSRKRRRDPVIRSPLQWFGGKAELAPWIIDHFPPHEI